MYTYFDYNCTGKYVELAGNVSQKTTILQLEDWQRSGKHHSTSRGIYVMFLRFLSQIG